MYKALLKTMRPKQWAKNVFLLAAVVFDRKLTNVDAILHTFLGVVTFSLIASVVYIINDIAAGMDSFPAAIGRFRLVGC